MDRRAFLNQTALTTAACTLPSLALAADSPLSEHRIDRVEFRTVSVPWPRQVGRNSTKGIHGQGPTRLRVCVLHTNRGATGWGQTQGKTGKAEQLLELVQGKSIAELIDPRTGITSDKYHAIDIPLHDLAGVILERPVWALAGADEPRLTKVYSGMIYFDDLDPADNPAGIDQVLENCRWDYEYGYRQLKVKIGRGTKWMPPKVGLQRDIDVVKAIHQAFPKVEILVDGNNGFTVDTMIAFLDGIADVPLFWIEEPFHETVTDWTRLRDYLVANGRKETLRADGEAKPDFATLERLQRDHTLNVRLEDICGHGFTRWRHQMPRLTRQGIAASPHTWGTALKTVYAAHFAAAYGNAPTIEGVTTRGGDVGFGENKIVHAQFHPSHQPGFGLALPS
ncbi:MAG TPA: mandelate racemase/muconate lactonizing protein [Planctomycetaceae bacterium]|nr:mandelate racemase/muconate lactonizing protein [Blastopirellula sp.]HAY79079.1 mandelate racemase/muconate lactonizing protein [Planctomycetaceae bacterium]